MTRLLFGQSQRHGLAALSKERFGGPDIAYTIVQRPHRLTKIDDVSPVNWEAASRRSAIWDGVGIVLALIA